MNRRAFLTTIGTGLLAAPLAAEAQQGARTWRVGFLSGGGRPPDGAPPLPLRQALEKLGYVEQQNVIYLSRWANAKQDRQIEQQLGQISMIGKTTVNGTQATKLQTSLGSALTFTQGGVRVVVVGLVPFGDITQIASSLN